MRTDRTISDYYLDLKDMASFVLEHPKEMKNDLETYFPEAYKALFGAATKQVAVLLKEKQ